MMEETQPAHVEVVDQRMLNMSGLDTSGRVSMSGDQRWPRHRTSSQSARPVGGGSDAARMNKVMSRHHRCVSPMGSQL